MIIDDSLSDSTPKNLGRENRYSMKRVSLQPDEYYGDHIKFNGVNFLVAFRSIALWGVASTTA